MPNPRCLLRINRSSFLLIHGCWQDFILSRWSDNPLVYAIWSSFCCAYTMSMVVYTGFKSDYGIKILIWLTYWSFYCLTLRFTSTCCHCWFYIILAKKRHSSDPLHQEGETDSQRIEMRQEQFEHQGIKYTANISNAGNSFPEENSVAACNNKQLEVNGSLEGAPVSNSHDKKSVICRTDVTADNNDDWTNSECLPLGLLLQWFLQNISNAVSLLVTVLFWSLVYTKGQPQNYSSINSHVINSILVIGDIMISRAPIRIQHFHIPVTYLGIYVLFTLIYWAASGKQYVIYEILDYSSRPLAAALAIIMLALFGVLLTQVCLYLLYRLRNALYSWKRTGSFTFT